MLFNIHCTSQHWQNHSIYFINFYSWNTPWSKIDWTVMEDWSNSDSNLTIDRNIDRSLINNQRVIELPFCPWPSLSSTSLFCSWVSPFRSSTGHPGSLVALVLVFVLVVGRLSSCETSHPSSYKCYSQKLVVVILYTMNCAYANQILKFSWHAGWVDLNWY